MPTSPAIASLPATDESRLLDAIAAFFTEFNDSGCGILTPMADAASALALNHPVAVAVRELQVSTTNTGRSSWGIFGPSRRLWPFPSPGLAFGLWPLGYQALRLRSTLPATSLRSVPMPCWPSTMPGRTKRVSRTNSAFVSRLRPRSDVRHASNRPNCGAKRIREVDPRTDGCR